MNVPQSDTRRRFPLRLAVMSVVGLVLAGFVVLAIRYSRHSPVKPAPRPEKTPAVAQRQDAIPADIVHFCGNCQATPDPMTFPRQAWEEEVVQGYDFYKVSRRQDLRVPPTRQVFAWYRNHAPLELSVSVPPAASAALPLQFRQTSVPPRSGQRFSAVAHLRWLAPAERIAPAEGILTRALPATQRSHACHGLSIPATAEWISSP